MSAQNVLNLVSNAITGNAASSQATIVPTLNSIQDPLLQVVNTTSVAAQGQTYIKNYWNVNIQEIFPQTVNSNNLTFNFATSAMSRLQDYVLQCNMIVTFSVQTGNLPTFVTSGTAPSLQENFKCAHHPSYAFLQWINNLDFRMGANALQFGRFPMGTQKFGSPVNQTALQSSRYYGYSDQLSRLVQCGIPAKAQISFSQLTKNAEVLDAYANYLTEIYTSAICNLRVATTASVSITIPVCVPLRFLNSMFDNEAMMPPGTLFRYTFTVDTGIKPLFSPGSASGNLGISANCQLVADGNLVLKYLNYTMTPDAQLLYNNQLFAQPLILHMTDQEYYDFRPPTTTTFNEQVCVSSQMPRAIKLVVFNNSAANVTLPIFFANNTTTTLTNFANSTCLGIVISKVQVVVSGRDSLVYNTNVLPTTILGSTQSLLDANHYLMNDNIIYTEREGYQDRIDRSNPVGIFDEFSLIINLDPSMSQRLDYKTMDPGSAVVRLSFVLTDSNGNALGTNYTVRCYKLLDSQISLNAAQQASAISWPATALSSGKPPAIQQTFNQVQ